MSVSMNNIVKELSSKEAQPSTATGSPSMSSELAREKSSSSVVRGQPLSAREQTAALAERYGEAGLNVSVNFQHLDGHLVYIVKDRESGEVIRQIPSEEALRISKHLDRLTGIMLDKSVE
jgi:flagellar protein FlaG